MGLQTIKFLTGSILSIAFASLAVVPASARPLEGSEQYFSQVQTTTDRTVSGTIVTVLQDAVNLRLPDGTNQVVNLPAGETSRLNLQPGDRVTATLNQNGVMQLSQTNNSNNNNLQTPGTNNNQNLNQNLGNPTRGTQDYPSTQPYPTGVDNQSIDQGPNAPRNSNIQRGTGVDNQSIDQGPNAPGNLNNQGINDNQQNTPGTFNNQDNTLQRGTTAPATGNQPDSGIQNNSVDDGTGPVRALW